MVDYPQQQQQHQLSNSYSLTHPGNTSGPPMGTSSGNRYDQPLGSTIADLGGGSEADGDSKKRKLEDESGPDNDKDKDAKESKDSKGGASDFVKKLYRMLEDANFTDIVSWGNTGDSFVVKDMNQFTRSILPLHFKHSNFASFVRQLNKYDFHKVKAGEDGQSQYGEHTWEFRHPNFRSDMKSSLEHIRRKAPAPRKSTPTPQPRRPGQGPAGPQTPTSTVDASLGGHGGSVDYGSMQAQLDSLHRSHQGMSQHLNILSQDYQTVMQELMNFQRNMVAQDQLMQNLIQYLVNLEADQKSASGSEHGQNAPFVPSTQAQKLISTYTEVARASYDQMADLSRRASLPGSPFHLMPLPPPPPSFGHINVGSNRDTNRREDGRSNGKSGFDPRNRGQDGQYQQQQQQQQQQHQSHQQQPHHQSQQMSQQRDQEATFVHPDAPQETAANASARRPTYVPGWAVPPRVLLVEDDAVCRKLSSKFLQVFGCNIDVAVDGVSAVNKMNVQKYDLVLMDIMMPNLDGVSATSLIRQFDPTTPIISMTSNSGPNEIMTYFSHGMNDILPKPFTKEGLLGMLEKHLIHLKVMQQMAEIPRALGFTDNQIQDALAVSVSDDGQVVNPFSAMGISDTDYVEMLQGIALEKEGKRGLEVVQGNEREGKRARFQAVGE